MPTLLHIDGFKFFFYANEHEPCHIHVLKGDSFFKIELETLRISKSHMKSGDFKKAVAIIEKNREEFIRRWNEYFNKR